jgi:hypothetical protein
MRSRQRRRTGRRNAPLDWRRTECAQSQNVQRLSTLNQRTDTFARLPRRAHALAAAAPDRSSNVRARGRSPRFGGLGGDQGEGRTGGTPEGRMRATGARSRYGRSATPKLWWPSLVAQGARITLVWSSKWRAQQGSKPGPTVLLLGRGFLTARRSRISFPKSRAFQGPRRSWSEVRVASATPLVADVKRTFRYFAVVPEAVIKLSDASALPQVGHLSAKDVLF